MVLLQGDPGTPVPSQNQPGLDSDDQASKDEGIREDGGDERVRQNHSGQMEFSNSVVQEQGDEGGKPDVE